MSDDKREDRWTDGPELEPDEAREVRRQREAPPAPPAEDAETLRERQRLAQMEMMDRWIGGVLVEQRRSRRWKLFFRLFFALLILASLAATLYGIFGTPSPGAPAGPHLGVVKVKGAIDSESPASAERIIEGLNRAWDAEGAAVVVLHIDSPGGSPVQSQRIFDEVMRLRDEGDKPIVAVIEDVGASGAYYIAAAADEVIAAPASLVGSIGVISASFGFEEAIERLGVERRVYAAGENKAFLDPFSSVAPEQRAFWQSVLETTHRQFIDDVRQGRGDRLADDERLFSGLIWSGEQALELGLVDTIGSLDGLARERLPEPRVRDYTPRLDPFERISRQFGRVAMEWLGVPTGQSPLRYQLP
ncbi:signal peptide peptidase SppA [Halomonas sp. M4R5S39]|uniref:signal peptide peptidase SppA n=1 Tax=Halomonas kalidii TaxID=3043293 RepID=UPI0024A83D44|nr:signal peptide peptidase SppA [Halomonas kalidii]MDI5985099.1 signal peptide peptidase SppA [Halomonas kalidii]